ncbi:hypothetical protein [Sphingomonas bacterium]|uniref:PAS domain-containing protein n=1 Tax=Sphingomonas bacterium TaxID=1895847 RepID=UPI001576C494|nr:hypothetical protein [Sphingomonas bacterium]
MDSARGFDRGNAGVDQDDVADTDVDASFDDAMFDLGGDERRMHVRAYNHWVSLLRGRPYPSIADLDPDTIVDFGANSALLDFSGGIDDPKIAYLGRTLREECGLEIGVARIADVPTRSLLSRLTDHYLQIIANRAPIGFEAEFVNTRGLTTLYRGILMPFSSDGDAIDFIYGVINWKEVANQQVQASLDAELAAAVHGGAMPGEPAIWADGPSGGFGTPDDGADGESIPGVFIGSLDDRLMMARESAAAARAADTRSRAVLYRALGRAHDFAIAAAGAQAEYDALLGRAGIVVQARAPMTPVVKLVFGADYDKTRLTEYAAVLQHAARNGVASGGLPLFLDAFDGGVKAVVAAERAARKPDVAVPVPQPAFADRPAMAHVSIDTGATPGSLVVLVARVAADGTLDVVGSIANDAALNKRVLTALA